MHTIAPDQIPLLQGVYLQAGLEFVPASIRVEPMADGGMGSLRLSTASADSLFARNAAELSFLDSDGVLVTAALYIDQYDRPFEVDLWKVDFSRLLCWPAAWTPDKPHPLVDGDLPPPVAGEPPDGRSR